ncbi:homoserine dehydrogenase [soil metagenome]
MSSIVTERSAAPPAQLLSLSPARVALLGCGTVGSAFVRLATQGSPGARQLRITGALVRDAHRIRPLPALTLTENALALIDGAPDVVVELLGGLEPARTLVLESLSRGIPVVTANKALLARHGRELREAARKSGTPLLYEAAVIAGVPFLGTFSRRPRSASANGLCGIVNGTSNFVLTRCAQDACSVAEALAEAQRRGYAESDPLSDVSGSDARDKLAVLLQDFAGLDADTGSIATLGLDVIGRRQPAHAWELGGVIKPVVVAEWGGGVLEAFVGPAFIPAGHPLASVDGVENGLVLHTPRGRLIFQGPGAGPDVTAATVLDDVEEVLAGARPVADRPLLPASATEPLTGWLVTIEGARLPHGADVADLLASHGLFAHRVSATHTEDARESRSLLLWPAEGAAVQHMLAGLSGAAGCTALALRSLGEPR